ncbi:MULTISPECIES: flagellar biosynthesis protein FlhF [unclassified Neptuniibacter]|uniref:flagellar biosynthesis protein FlhF n=1 Tax=unclassified Neptuniibacter TaxID=2630693 RepID=UPI000C377001|nr:MULTISPECIES: flagellar biosynthesis protein FlhF [unclassified Neptuniibacter]MAY43605.1 flagellar biosynthesis protein FlhF [Oceanospirillaceae bacterium]
MKVKRFFAPDMRQAMRRVRDEIGPDAVIVSNHRVAGGVEVVAAHENDYEVAQQEFTRKKKVTQKRQGQIDVLTKGRDGNLESELQKARMQIAEANQTGRQNSDMAGKVNRQLDADDEDLRSILTSLKQRQKQKANVAFQNSLNASALGENSLGLDLQDELSMPPSSSGGANDQMIRSMQDEIAQLKNLLSQQIATSQMGGAAHSKPPVQRKLELLGVSEKLSSHLLTSMDVQVSPDKAWKSALSKLSESIPVLGEDFIERGGMIAFVGPTGVGKTTTIGKLAARYVLKYGSSSLALVTTDTFRIAAHEQLRTFGRILDVPVRVVDATNSLDDVLHSLRNKRLVLIDTAGLNAQEPHSEAQLEMLEGVSLRLKKLLVVSCSSQRRVVEQAYNAYKRLGLNGCVLSKMDESGSLGEAISLIVEKGLPVTYVTDGQRIPDDIDVAKKNELVSRAVITAQRAIEAEKNVSALDAAYKMG